MIRIYLGGPEVFLPDPVAAGVRKKRVCAAHGCEGVFPLDNVLELSGMNGMDAGYAIYRANRELMDSCDAIIANLTPFRGPSADAGTVFELGYMRGAGKQVAAYSNVADGYAERARRLDPNATRDGVSWYDGAGMLIEDFDLADNLMLEGTLRDGGFDLVVHDASSGQLFGDLTAFARCVALVAEGGGAARRR